MKRKTRKKEGIIRDTMGKIYIQHKWTKPDTIESELSPSAIPITSVIPSGLYSLPVIPVLQPSVVFALPISSRVAASISSGVSALPALPVSSVVFALPISSRVAASISSGVSAFPALPVSSVVFAYIIYYNNCTWDVGIIGDVEFIGDARDVVIIGDAKDVEIIGDAGDVGIIGDVEIIGDARDVVIIAMFSLEIMKIK